MRKPKTNRKPSVILGVGSVDVDYKTQVFEGKGVSIRAVKLTPLLLQTISTILSEDFLLTHPNTICQNELFRRDIPSSVYKHLSYRS